MISKLKGSQDTRESYIRSKLSVLLPGQIRSLRLRRRLTQAELGEAANMKQVRISTLERVGDSGFSLSTLIRLAAAFRIGLMVKFVPLSEMLAWENSFTPDDFDVIRLDQDLAFLNQRNERNQDRISPGLSEAMRGIDYATKSLSLTAICSSGAQAEAISTHHPVNKTAGIEGLPSQPRSVDLRAFQNQEGTEQGNAA